MAKNEASIDPDDLLERPLGEITAAQFVQALGSSRFSSSIRYQLADKKKYELWVEEVVIERIPLGELIERVKGEKKKVELELPWDWRHIVDPPPELIETLADKVAERLRS